MIPAVLTIAGSDPSGGAGIQADLKTFHQRKVYGMAVITLLTAQNTRGVDAVYIMKPFQIIRQLKAVLSDILPQVIKIGALGGKEVVRTLSRQLKKEKIPLIIDPVMISKHGVPLMRTEAIRVFKKELLPLAALLTPNLHEAGILTGDRVHDLPSMEKAARKILRMGARAVLVKGGHLKGEAVDLFLNKDECRIFSAARFKTKNTHGTGCTYSAAIAAEVAKGRKLIDAVKTAKCFITQAIRTAPGLGQGMGPVNYWALV